MHAAPPVDASHCPICGGANACAMETEQATGLEQGPCWCMTAHFDNTRLTQIPAAARGLACICSRCAASQARGT